MAPGEQHERRGNLSSRTVKVALPPVETLPRSAWPAVGHDHRPDSRPPDYPAGTVVTVTAGVPMTYTFTLSTAAQPKVVSDKPRPS